MHQQILEAQKRLQVAKDHYAHAVQAIEAQYVRPLVGQGIEAEAVAQVRASYDVSLQPFAPLQASDHASDVPKSKPGKPRAAKKKGK